MTREVKISACIIMRDAAEDIGACLRSLLGLVDEFIVVDTGSVDDSVSIAEKLVGKVYHFPWRDDFAAAKNYAIEQATGDWILFLDADESLTEETRRNLPVILSVEGLEEMTDILMVYRANVRTDTGEIQDRDRAGRIFRRLPELRYRDPIHEYLAFSDGHKPRYILLEPHQLLIRHTGYSPERMREKSDRNLRLLERLKAAGSQKFLLNFYMAVEYLSKEEYGKAAEAAREAIRRKESPEGYPFRAMLLLYKALDRLGEEEEMESLLAQGMKKYPRLPEFFVFHGRRRKRQGRLAEALESLRRGAENIEGLPRNYPKFLSELPEELPEVYSAMAEICEESGRKEEAREYREKSEQAKKSLEQGDGWEKLMAKDQARTENGATHEAHEAKQQKASSKGMWVDDYMRIHPGPVAGGTKLEGVRIDFNHGARVQVPKGEWRVRLIDLARAFVVKDIVASETMVESVPKYFVPWRIEVWKDGELALGHNLELRGQKVFVKFCSGAIGDSLAWIPYVEAFRRKHGCEIAVSMNPEVAKLLTEAYPELSFLPPKEQPTNVYASYYLGCFFPSDSRIYQPSSWKPAGLQKAIAHILDLPEEVLRPDLRRDCPRSIREPYVCIASQASSQAKYWNNPEGWIRLIQWLKEQGYRVLCIDRERCYGLGWQKNIIPWGAEDFTGARPLAERLELLSHADFFVGLPSGLSWLAWAAGLPVVLISGFSLPHTEFPNPYRVINYHVCTGCWEDERYDFEHENFHWCPRHQGDVGHQFECTRMINHMQVIRTCRRLMEDHGLRPGEGRGSGGGGDLQQPS